jgi:glycerol-3-phosphate acyltransferase PlsX
MSIRIVVDAMGGDDAPDVVVQGAAMVLAESDRDVHLILTGPAQRVGPLVQELPVSAQQRITVVDAPDIIGMDDSPTTAIKTKTASSIHVGLGLCKQGKADGFVSAGNTGAVMAGSLFILGRLPGVSRPSVIGYFPTVKGTCIVLDVGTNVDCKPDHLVQFAHMGAIYAERVLGVGEPRCALLNVGEEPGKGDELAKAAHEALTAASGLHFVGNVEGRDIMKHAADVVVCDGFTGNILLRMLGAEMHRLAMSPEEQGTVAKAFGGVKARFDYREFGGVPLLGVDGNVVIGHGGSDAYAIKNMILAADSMIASRVTPLISEAMNR